VNFLEDASAEPWRFDFFTTMRLLERSHSQQPRLSDSATLREDFVTLGQDPYLEFPASNLTSVEKLPAGRLRVLVRFLGLLGPQGALPLATTEEAYQWNLMRDDAFPRFLDLFNNRFLQLFFRAWADSRPIAQHDRPR
jgi:type VI secretion system protein ImpH